MLDKDINSNVLDAFKRMIPDIHEELEKDKEHKEVTKEIDRLMESVKTMSKDLFMQLDDLINRDMVIRQDIMYQKGMQDSIQILKFLKAL